MIKVGEKIVSIEHFPDGTQLIKGEGIPFCCSTEIEWIYENDEEMVSLLYIARHLQKLGAKSIDLVMLYIPNARQDRVKSKNDVFTLKYFAEFINFLGFRKVYVLDPHSNVSEALIDNIEVVTPEKYIGKAIEYSKADMLFFPDEGAMKRYSGMSPLPYSFGIKKRDWSTGEIRGLAVMGSTDLANGSTILIVDDICSRGGTFYHSAKRLKELGAGKIYLYVTHCENTILQGEILKSGLIEEVYTTSSIFTAEHERIRVIPI